MRTQSFRAWPQCWWGHAPWPQVDRTCQQQALRDGPQYWRLWLAKWAWGHYSAVLLACGTRERMPPQLWRKLCRSH